MSRAATLKTQAVAAPRTSIAIIDPQPMYRAGILRILTGRPSLQVLGEGASLAEARSLARRHAVDVMILDVGLDADTAGVADLRRTFPDMAIIAVGGASDVDGIAEAMRAGVKGCVPRAIDGPGLLDAVERVSKGELYVAPSMGWHLLSRLASGRSEPKAAPAIISFTSREDEIMHLVALGSTNKEVARKLHVSVKTVKHHLTNVMQKLRVRNRVEAVVAFRARKGSVPAPGEAAVRAAGL